MEEIWKDVLGYEGKYMVSNLGRVKSIKWRNGSQEKIMIPQNNGNGYLFIGLRNRGPKKHHYIHRLVWETFIGKIPYGMEINHLDENPQNNRLDNLSIVTRKENLNWGNHSHKQHFSQINGKTSKPVVQYDMEGKYITTFPSQIEAARQIGIDSASINKCCKGKMKSRGGFKWSYCEDSLG